ncbi:MAG: HAD family hydrolase [Lachnospiraceae bacterium]|nr:HAD family hydrolase [Lachnospiraceae bacterium]
MKAQLPPCYDNYIFDLYGTLVDIHTEEDFPLLWEKMSLFCGYYGARYLPDELKQAWNQMAQTLLRRKDLIEASGRSNSYEAFPEIDLRLVIRELYAQKGVPASPELIVHTGQFFRVLSTEYIRLYEGTVEMLSSLRASGKKLWLLSNAQRIFTEYELHLLDIGHCFDGILISSDFGVGKPNPRFFQELVIKYGVDFKRSLFIGNDAVNDIGGAQAVGLDTFYVHSNLSNRLPERMSKVNYPVLDFTGWAVSP